MNLYSNFLPKKIFKQLKDAIMSNSFPWYYNDDILKNKKSTNFQFTFTFLIIMNISVGEDGKML